MNRKTITKEEYIVQKKKSEEELNRIMTDGFYSENKISDLEKLKENLMHLRKIGVGYEK